MGAPEARAGLNNLFSGHRVIERRTHNFHLGHDWLLLLSVDRDGGGVNPGGGAKVPQPDVGVLGHQGVSSTGPGGRVELEQRGQVVGVRD